MNRARNEPDAVKGAVASVVVTYQPDAAVVEHVRCLALQSADLYLVDNASTGEPAQWVEAAARIPGVTLIRNATNAGIASALNTGIVRARQAGHLWIATFDQDTSVAPDYFEQLLRVYNRCDHADRIGMIVPGGWIEPGTSRSQRPAAEWSFVTGALNSGSVIRSGILDETGLYDEPLFIDYVDTEFCLRLQQRGFQILSVNSVILEHELGHKQTRNILGRTLSFRIHTAWRYYYIMRNRVLVYRRYAGAFPRWALNDFCWMILELGRIVFLEKERGPKIRAALAGVRDGVLKRTGRHPDYPTGAKRK